MNVCAIASGSNGNCYYVGNANEAVLIDAGLSCKELDRRMKRAGLSMDTVKAIFISHEHSDHISGLTLISKKFNLPVFLSASTHEGGRIWIDKPLINYFSGDEEVVIGDLSVVPFKKFHDAADPYSFTIHSQGVCVGVITDIGRTCPAVVQHFSQCHAVFLESNYDEKMLEKGRYPFYLKNRIRGGMGHISNREALELFQKHRSPFLSHLFLSHLSHNNNCPQLVADLFSGNAAGVKTIVTSRFQETLVYQVGQLSRLATNNYAAFVQQPQLNFGF